MKGWIKGRLNDNRKPHSWACNVWILSSFPDITLVARHYKIYCPAIAFDLLNIGTSSLPDMYTQGTRATGLRAGGERIR